MDDGPRPYPAPLLLNAVLATVFLGFCVTSSTGIVGYLTDAFAITSAVVGTGALLLLQVACFGRLNRYPRVPLRCAALLVQACLVYLPLIQYREAWVSKAGFLAGSVLLALHVTAALPLFALVVASMGWVQLQLTRSGTDVAFTVVSTIIIGLVVFGLTRLANLVTDLLAARHELARSAVAEERLRFARDLHDLLGMSLSAITLKCELTGRLITDQPTRAREELAEILTVAQRAHDDIRSVSSGYRQLSLHEECASAESVLAVADVVVVLRRDHHVRDGELPRQAGTLLATVLREGVTNVLRHSRATRCDIQITRSARSVSIELVNDGASERPGRRGGTGSGLRNLSDRVRTVHGVLVAEHLPDERFRLYATIPLAEPRKTPGRLTTSRHPWRFGWRRPASAR